MMVVSNSLTLAGTNIMDVNKTGSVILNDVITNITTVTYGGTLQLNLTGTALAAGDASSCTAAARATTRLRRSARPRPAADCSGHQHAVQRGVLSVIPSVNTGSTNITTVVTGSTSPCPGRPTISAGAAGADQCAGDRALHQLERRGRLHHDQLINVTLDAVNGAVFYRMVYP